MEITSVDSVPVGHDVEDQGLQYSSGQLTAWNSPLVRVEIDTGAVGWGEANRAFQRAEAVEPVLARLRHYLVGSDPRDVDSLVAGMRRSTFPRMLEESVVGALEVAIYDVLGQATGEPVYELLDSGDTDGTVTAYGSGGLGETIDQRVEQAVAFTEEGFSTVKIRGMPTTDGTLELVERTIEAVGPDVEIAVDDTGNEGLSEVLELVEAMSEFSANVAWFEDPAPSRNDLRGYREIRAAAEFPVTGMETCAGVAEFHKALEYDCVDAIHPDASRIGYRDLGRVSGDAGARDVPLYLHVWGGAVTLIANAHYGAADPNCEAIEYPRLPNPLRETLLPEGLDRDGDRLALPDAPGLGLDIPDDIAERYPYQPGTGHVSK